MRATPCVDDPIHQPAGGNCQHRAARRPCQGRPEPNRKGARVAGRSVWTRAEHGARLTPPTARLRAAPRDAGRLSLTTSRDCHSGEDVVGCKDSQAIPFAPGRCDAQPLHGVATCTRGRRGQRAKLAAARCSHARRSQPTGIPLDRAAGAIIARVLEFWSEVAVERPALAADTLGGLLQE